MKKNTALLYLFAAGLTLQTANAQLAKKKNISLEEIGKEINALAAKGDEESKKQLEIEANALAASKNEDFVSLAGRLYQYLGKEDKVNAIQASITKRFPKGIAARQQAFNAIFEKTDQSASAAELAYNAWLKKFSASTYTAKEQAIIDQGKVKLAVLYFKENNNSKANAFVEDIKGSTNAIANAYTLGNELSKINQSKQVLPLLAMAYAKTEKAFTATNEAENKSLDAQYFSGIAGLYAQALLADEQPDNAVMVVEGLFAKAPNTTYNPVLNLYLAKAIAKQGKELNAFLLLEKFMLKNGKNEGMLQEMTELYSKLNHNKADFNDYLVSFNKQAKEALIVKYKGEMIKKEAPQFALLDRDGKTVSLADYKGKVVVIDFWATWCGPCKISFPGMQAAVNKYQEDKEVAFLFIDTWQREENYKELVENFITENNYTFHVLFDEMKDRSKAITTAYGVKGIPHKVVIDKEGFIRFEASGGSADVEKIVNEMETKIELARKG